MRCTMEPKVNSVAAANPASAPAEERRRRSSRRGWGGQAGRQAEVGGAAGRALHSHAMLLRTISTLFTAASYFDTSRPPESWLKIHSRKPTSATGLCPISGLRHEGANSQRRAGTVQNMLASR